MVTSDNPSYSYLVFERIVLSLDSGIKLGMFCSNNNKIELIRVLSNLGFNTENISIDSKPNDLEMDLDIGKRYLYIIHHTQNKDKLTVAS